MLEATSSSTYNRPRLKISAKWKRTWSFPVSNLISPNVMLCSHELISLMLMASLALVAALPVDSDSGAVSAEGVREERARKESGKLRLEHRGGEDDIHSVGEVVEASEFVSSPAEKSVAQAQPVGVASAGQGGVAVSAPQGVAVVGPGGLAVSRPIAVAVAGPGAENLLIFLRPDGGSPPDDGEEGGEEEEGSDGPPDVEEPDDEKPPVAMFYGHYAPGYFLYYPLHPHYPIF